jgi:dihydrofolate reductase
VSEKHGHRIVHVAAVADNGVIGDGPDIPWQIPGEQAWFKQYTMGHTLLMGRTTFRSIGRPLPGRETIVLTRQEGWSYFGVHVAHDLAQALRLAERTQGDLMVAGGAEVYAATMPFATEQVLTRVHLTPPGNVLYPAYDESDWTETDREVHEAFDRIHLTRSAAP